CPADLYVNEMSAPRRCYMKRRGGQVHPEVVALARGLGTGAGLAVLVLGPGVDPLAEAVDLVLLKHGAKGHQIAIKFVIPALGCLESQLLIEKTLRPIAGLDAARKVQKGGRAVGGAARL